MRNVCSVVGATAHSTASTPSSAASTCASSTVYSKIRNTASDLYLGVDSDNKWLRTVPNEKALIWYQVGPSYQCILVTFVQNDGQTVPRFLDFREVTGSGKLYDEVTADCIFRIEKASTGNALLNIRYCDYLSLKGEFPYVCSDGDPSVPEGVWEFSFTSRPFVLRGAAHGSAYLGSSDGKWLNSVPVASKALKWYQAGPNDSCIFVTFVRSTLDGRRCFTPRFLDYRRVTGAVKLHSTASEYCMFRILNAPDGLILCNVKYNCWMHWPSINDTPYVDEEGTSAGPTAKWVAEYYDWL
ncbi:hypothetical protein Pelo_16928 [Pelomyxa schiedti]|nr:hypothetical protein Pelo_16928 [Pelomyxa schiedti]